MSGKERKRRLWKEMIKEKLEKDKKKEETKEDTNRLTLPRKGYKKNKDILEDKL